MNFELRTINPRTAVPLGLWHVMGRVELLAITEEGRYFPVLSVQPEGTIRLYDNRKALAALGFQINERTGCVVIERSVLEEGAAETATP